VTIEGTAPADTVVGRDGARVGDLVLVSGTLGDSALALALWQRGEQPGAFLASRHHRPAPRIALGRELARARLPSAMIDLSDGLASDLGHILEASGVGAEVDAAALPLSPAFRTHLARRPALFDLALAGGEDYELLCTVPPEQLAAALAIGTGTGVPLTVVGKVTDSAAGLQLRSDGGMLRPLRIRGYEHFPRGAGDADR
jgi:thiamine-monophosphate kinase